MMIYNPLYILIYLIILIAVYIFSITKALNEFKFNTIGYVYLVLSFFSCVILLLYFLGHFNLQDTEEMIFSEIGIFQVLLFTHPFILLILACILGVEKKQNNK